MKKEKSFIGESNSIIMEQIINNLSQNNLYFQKTTEGVRVYTIHEHKSQETINLSNLAWWISEKLDMNPKYQRNSNDHKSRTPQQIVVDYLSGQSVGAILLHKDPRSNKKEVVDGRHRIIHLHKFLSGKLILNNKEAQDFWSLYLDKINQLLEKSQGNIETNKLLWALLNPKKNKDGITLFPSVDFTKLPSIIKDDILNGVKLDINEISIKVQDVYGTDLAINKIDYDFIEQIIWRKFTRMNTNSGKITVDDAIWNLPSPYQENSTNLASNPTIQTFFGIQDFNNSDEKKKLNEILFTMMLFLDNKHSWGGSTKVIINKSHNPRLQVVENNASDFFSIFNNSISRGYGRMFSRGEKLNLPTGFLTMAGGNKTNVKQYMLFIYLFHKLSQQPMYNETPTFFHKSVLELGAKIIQTCVIDKHGYISEEVIRQNNLTTIFSENRDLMYKIAEYRKNQRKYEDVLNLYRDLVHLCISYVY